MGNKRIVFHYGNLPKCKTNKLHLQDSKWVHFHLDEPWAYSADKKIMLKHIYCFRDIEAVRYVNVYVFSYKSQAYFLHTVMAEWVAYILNIYGKGTLSESFISAMVQCMEFYINKKKDEWLHERKKRFSISEYEHKDISVRCLAEEMITTYNGIDMNLYGECDPDWRILEKYGL
ncbi:MAG: hypothetical protein K2L82_06475 [Lachnospiraceae bacterium]|nr:hypothetical protein [Lachnospiraceae bacterium]